MSEKKRRLLGLLSRGKRAREMVRDTDLEVSDFALVRPLRINTRGRLLYTSFVEKIYETIVTMNDTIKLRRSRSAIPRFGAFNFI